MRKGVRLFLWRHQRGLTVLYLGGLALAWLAYLAFTYALPRSIDVGISVAARARAYFASFEEVNRAREDIESGSAIRLEDARVRLQRFIDEHAEVQSSQLATHAVVLAHELLADVHQRQGRPGRAVSLLKSLARRLPLNYRVWYLLGSAEKGRGDLTAAAQSLHEAFRLSLHNPGVTSTYLGVLADLGRYERIVWVADAYRQAERRASPAALVKMGVPRGRMQRSGLVWAGVPVEHGVFSKSFEVRGLARGASHTIRFPTEMMEGWSGMGEYTIHVRFEHVYSDLRVEALRCRAGEKIEVHRLDPRDVRSLHQPHSSREAFAEFDLRFDPGEWREVELVYSCPEHKLSDDTLAIVAKALENLKPGG